MPDWLLYYAVAINLYAFLLCGVDKARAVKHKKRGVRRIPERDLWLICLIGGCLGMYLGMIVVLPQGGKAALCLGRQLFMCRLFRPMAVFFQRVLALRKRRRHAPI